MRILIATTQVPFVQGGAEIQAQSLKKALIERGHLADIVAIPFKWYPPEKIHEHLLATRLLDVTESNGVPIDRVIGLKFPAYHIQHPNKVMWVIHQHRTAFEMWRSEHCDLSHYEFGKAARDSIEKIERNLFPEAKKVYSECQNVGDRLKKFCGIDSTPIYHPPQDAETFYHNEPEDFFYYPSRLNRWKRQDLVLKAMAETKEPVKVIFSGAPDNPEYEQKLLKLVKHLGLEKRANFVGRIPFPEMQELYSKCKAVIFPPDNEDYGYITLESMLSGKPVITCNDSGGPVEFLRDSKDGFITNPSPEGLATAMDELWKSNKLSEEMGANARKRYADLNISWDSVVSTLVK